jgi:four helix bundle protein
MFAFGKLDAWQHAIDFADVVYSLTRQFPDSDSAEMASRLRRAAVSVSSNIAAGSSGRSRKDYIRRVETAAGSLSEVISLSRIARQKGFLTADDFKLLSVAAEVQGFMLDVLRRSLRTDS